MWLSGRALRQQRKGCGFDSQGTHILMKMYNLNAIVSSLWIKASDKVKCPYVGKNKGQFLSGGETSEMRECSVKVSSCTRGVTEVCLGFSPPQNLKGLWFKGQMKVCSTLTQTHIPHQFRLKQQLFGVNQSLLLHESHHDSS